MNSTNYGLTRNVNACMLSVQRRCSAIMCPGRPIVGPYLKYLPVGGIFGMGITWAIGELNIVSRPELAVSALRNVVSFARTCLARLPPVVGVWSGFSCSKTMKGVGSMVIVGNRIRAERQAKGWSQWDLARKMDIHPRSIGLWEAGKVMPRPKQLESLATLFGCEVGDLFRAA